MTLEVISIPGGYTVYYYRASDGALTSSISNGVTSGARFFSQDKTPRTRGLRPDGKPGAWLYPKAYDLSVKGYRHVSVDDIFNYSSWERRRELGNMSQWVPWSQDGFTIPPEDPADIAKAEIKALLKLKDQRINFGVAMAEAQQTADLVGSTAKRLAHSLDYLQQGDFKRLARELGVGTLKSIPQGWIELQYAWKPLLSDVAGVTDKLAQRPPRDWVVSCKGTVKETWKNNITISGGTSSGTRTDASFFRGQFVRLDFVPRNDLQVMASNLGMTNPAEVFWEKVPYSFVIDWFLPVGDALRALDATWGYDFLSGSRTDRRECNRQISPATGGTYQSQRWSGGHYRDFELHRHVYREAPSMIMPRVKNPLSLGHMANGLSLLAQLFRSPLAMGSKPGRRWSMGGKF